MASSSTCVVRSAFAYMPLIFSLDAGGNLFYS
jgi:hypothetical protein